MKRRHVFVSVCILLIAVLCSACGKKTPAKKKNTVTVQAQPMKKTEFLDTARGSICLTSLVNDPIPAVAETLELDRYHATSAVLMVSDGSYIYLSYHSSTDKAGLYRIDLLSMQAEKLDSGLYSYLTLRDGILYYYAESDATYRSFNAAQMKISGMTNDEYFAMRAKYNLDTGNNFPFPKDVVYWVHDGDRSYIINRLSRQDVVGDFPQSGYYYTMAYVSQVDGKLVNLSSRWQSRKQLKGIMVPYGKYYVYTRAFQYEDQNGNRRMEYAPCFYDSKTSAETVLVRNRGYDPLGSNDCYVLGVTADYLLVSDMDDEFKKDAHLYLEKIGSSEKGISVETLVSNAGQGKTNVLDPLEIYKDEPYGPGTSSLYLTSPSNMSAAYRLVRMDGTTQFMILMKPGENKTVTFPCGRYTLKIAKGETWISDEEAFGESGQYSTTGVFTFVKGKAYQIGSSMQGNVYKDSASGFSK